jgi:hypothetical protein
MLDFSKLGSVILVKYRMNDGTEHAVTFDNIREAYSFKGSCNSFIRKAIITNFDMQQVARATL